MTVRETDAYAAIVTACAVGLLLIALSLTAGCSSTPPHLQSGGVRGTLTLSSPAGPVVIDLDTRAVVAEGQGWAVDAYELETWAVVEYQGIAHRVSVDAVGQCVSAHYTGVIVADLPIRGCTTPAEALEH